MIKFKLLRLFKCLMNLGLCKSNWGEIRDRVCGIQITFIKKQLVTIN